MYYDDVASKINKIKFSIKNNNTNLFNLCLNSRKKEIAIRIVNNSSINGQDNLICDFLLLL